MAWIRSGMTHRGQSPRQVGIGGYYRSQPTARKDWRRGSESNRRIKVLQTSPLPLGYRAPAPTLASRPEKVHLRRAGWKLRNLERETGVEPATSTLARSRSTTELLPLNSKIIPHPRFCAPASGQGALPLFPGYANSNSIFFAARSSFVIRKLRTCPARTGSAFTGPPAPLFHRACNIELSEERSAFDSFGASVFAGAAAVILQEAWIPSPSSTRAGPPESSIIRPVTTSPSLCSAM